VPRPLVSAPPFPEGAERNKALGIWGGVGALGGTVGLLAGGILTTYVGWQYIFFFNVPIGAAALALAPKVVPESRTGSARRRYDPFAATTIEVPVTSGTHKGEILTLRQLRRGSAGRAGRR